MCPLDRGQPTWVKSPGSPYLLAATDTGQEESAHLSSALIPGGREGRQGAGPHPYTAPAIAAPGRAGGVGPTLHGQPSSKGPALPLL